MHKNVINREQIIENERKLLEAFKNKDLAFLEEVLHESCLFNLPNGKTATKSDVIENYRSGNTVMISISTTDQIINLFDDVAVVDVIQNMKLNYFDQLTDSKYRYIRVWKMFSNKWKAISVTGIPLE